MATNDQEDCLTCVVGHAIFIVTFHLE